MGKGSKKQTIGYNYFADVHMVLCHAVPDNMHRIFMGDKLAWRGSVVRPEAESYQTFTRTASADIVGQYLVSGTDFVDETTTPQNYWVFNPTADEIDPTNTSYYLDIKANKGLKPAEYTSSTAFKDTSIYLMDIGAYPDFDGTFFTAEVTLELSMEGGRQFYKNNRYRESDHAFIGIYNELSRIRPDYHELYGATSMSHIFTLICNGGFMNYRLDSLVDWDDVTDMDNNTLVNKVTINKGTHDETWPTFTENRPLSDDLKIQLTISKNIDDTYHVNINGYEMDTPLPGPLKLSLGTTVPDIKVGSSEWLHDDHLADLAAGNYWGVDNDTPPLGTAFLKHRYNQTSSYNLVVSDALTLPELSINAPLLFGGKEREGGVFGKLWAMFGWPDQPRNPKLQELVGPNMPAYRGVFSLFFSDFCWGMSNYLKPVTVTATRVFTTTTGNTIWYPEKATWPEGHACYGDMNPAHIIWECLMDPIWGGGGLFQPDEDSFTAVADTLFDEGFGISILWQQETSIEEFISEILRHIDGLMYDDPITGFTKLKLIRGDYDPDLIPVLDKSNCRVTQFTMGNESNAINKLTVTYNRRGGDPRTSAIPDREASVTVVDYTSVSATGVNAQTNDYPGITLETIANQVAQRDLANALIPANMFTIETNRKVYDLMPGDVFTLTDPDYGIFDIVCRVGRRSDSGYADGRITLDCVEDVFSRVYGVYGPPTDTGWVSDTEVINNIASATALEVPHGLMVAQAGGAYNLSIMDPSWHFTTYLAAEPVSGAYLGYDRFTAPLVNDPATVSNNVSFDLTYTLENDIDLVATTIVLSGDIKNGVDRVRIGHHLYCGATAKGDTVTRELSGEIMYVTGVTGVAIQVKRAVHDTIPMVWPAGSKVFVMDELTPEGPVSEGDTTLLTGVPVSGQGRYHSDLEDDYYKIHADVDGRRHMPYPPARVTMNNSFGVMQSQVTPADIPFAWRHRDRLVQQDNAIGYYEDTNIGPEAGATYSLHWKSEGDASYHEINGLTGTSYVFTAATELTGTSFSTLPGDSSLVASDGRFEAEPSIAPRLHFRVLSQRDGYDSYKAPEFTIVRSGYGFYYGDYYGGPRPS